MQRAHGSFTNFFLVLLLATSASGAADLRSLSAASPATRAPQPFAVSAASEGGGVNVGRSLTSGVPAQFQMSAVTPFSAVNFYNGDSGFSIVVPPGASRLEVNLTTSPAVDIFLYVRFGTDVAVSGGAVVSDKVTEGPSGNTTIAVDPCTPLQAGTYFIAVLLNTTGVGATGTITATINGAPTIPVCQLLSSGTPAPFSLPAVTGSTLFRDDYSYRIVVPSGATQLQVSVVTATPGAQVSLYVRLGADNMISGGNVLSSYSSTASGGNQMVTVTSSSSPPLTSGAYFISLGLFTTGTAVSGTLTATVTGGGAAGGSGPNLIQNPGADAGPADPNCVGPVVIPAWTKVAGQPSVCAYGMNGGPLPSDPGPLDRGANYFAGGNDSPSTLSQMIDVSSSASQIDAGSLPFTLSGWLGGFDGQDDYATVRANFLSSSSVTLGTASIGPVYSADRNGATGLVSKSASGTVPAGTRSVQIVLDMNRTAGTYNDGYADSLSLVLGGSGGGGSCSYVLSSISQSFTASSGAGSVSVTVQPLCPSWTAVSNAPWITITSGASGTSQGTVNYSVAANSSSSPRTGTMTIAGQTFTVSQSGQTGTPAISVPSPLDFGSVAIGQSSNMNLNVSNTGTAALAVSNVASSNAEFSFLSPALPFTVPASGQAQLAVRFTPTAAGGRSATLTITSNDPARPAATVALTGSGQQQGGGASITASVNTITYSVTPGSNPPSQTFTVRSTVNYRVTTDQSWLSVNPASGAPSSNGSTHTASAAASSLGTGTYTGHITITAAIPPALSAEPPDPAQAFSVSITVTLTITAGSGATPVVTAAVNAASFASPSLPNGAISQGSIFTVFGQGVGPTTLVSASQFPLQASLGGVSVKVSKGSTSVDAIPLAVVGSQINAIMPSNAPTGQVQVTVTVNGRTSAPMTIQTASSSFGMFAANANGVGPGVFTDPNFQIYSARRSAQPGQFAIAWGTGLGGINGADNQAPPVGNLPVTLDITVGGKTVTNKTYYGRAPCCSGVDQVVFQIPADAPAGCFVPVIINVNGVPANATTMPIDPNGGSCSDPGNPLALLAAAGGKVGAVELVRVNVGLGVFGSLNADLGLAEFFELPAGGEFAYNAILSLPPIGTCSVFSGGGIDFTGLLAGGTGALAGLIPSSIRPLKAGQSLTIQGPNGTKTVPLDKIDICENTLGGQIPLLCDAQTPPYLDPGTYTVQGAGGADVGPFTVSVPIPSSINWTNQQQLALVDRSQGTTFTWTGGDPSQVVVMLGANADTQSMAGVAFLCLASPSAGSFTVPPAILAAFPASNSHSFGVALIGDVPGRNVPKFTASGILGGIAVYGQLFGTLTTFK